MPNTSSHGAAPPPGIPGLELQEPIGEGGMSVVYRAVHRNLQRSVAVKILAAPAEAGAAVPAWQCESRLLASLDHPHVVAIHDAGQVEGHSYLVMEYLAGGSLRARMEPGRPWPLDRAVPVLDHIAQALGHIHEKGILHLDLKPENILYTADGQIKIADFGLSVPRADATALLDGRPFQGTVDYCAPEYRAGLPVDARADVFSLATLAYELLTGRLPGRVFVPASRRNPRVPPALDAVLARGLARTPEDRYGSLTEFRHALIAAAHPPRARTRLLGVVAGLALVVTVVALTAAPKWRTTPTPAPAPPAPPVPLAERPDRVWVLHDTPDDLALVTGDGTLEGVVGPDVPVTRVQVQNPPQSVPPDLPGPVWPAPRPVLIARSPGAWGFVYPLTDRTLGTRVLKHWATLLRAPVPSDQNFAKAGGFDGNCLMANHEGPLWRVGDMADWTFARQIGLARPKDRPDSPALLLTNLDPVRGTDLVGCYQPLITAPAPGAVAVLRYRARAENGPARLLIYAGVPVVVPEADTGAVAGRVRGLGGRMAPVAADPTPDRWLFRATGWVTPAAEWQTYIAVSEWTQFPTRPFFRKLVIDAAGPGQVWVDDVELFVWRPEGEP